MALAAIMRMPSAQSGGQTQQQHQAPSVNLSGHWRKDKGNSNLAAFGQSLELLQMDGVQKRAAVILMNDLKINQDKRGLHLEFKLDRVPFFTHHEKFTFGKELVQTRRDKREGEQRVRLTKVANGLQVDIDLEGEVKGNIREVYTSTDSTTLTVRSVTRVGDRSSECTQVYKRAG